MNKYPILVNILDKLRYEAPQSFKFYYPEDSETVKLDQARSRAFIHLFLKVRYGLLDFKEREEFITDKTSDGGIDAYYIDSDKKVISFIQSKFRTNAVNFEEKPIALSELLAMDCDRISEGHRESESGIPYNSRIQTLIDKIHSLPDAARYDYKVIILANLKNVTSAEMRKLISGFRYEVFDHERTYNELVFPVVSGCYYNVSDLFIQLNLTNKEFSQSRINYPVSTEFSECDITVLFVPTIEIAKILYKYKNSLLNYNPRSYLEMAANSVNREIASTIESKKTNEFALFNNGITILSDETNLSEKVGKKDKGQLHIKNPQIINGGQTAYTLSKLFDKYQASGSGIEAFDDKEVMLKIITFADANGKSGDGKLKLIEAISKATNQQSLVNEADRRSNDAVQVKLQQGVFQTFGYFYERKRGEYSDGISSKYIDRSRVVDREVLLRVACAMNGKTSQARRQSQRKIFEKVFFESIVGDGNDYRKLFFGYKVLELLNQVEKSFSQQENNRHGVATFGFSLRYGKYAVVSVVGRYYNDDIKASEYEGKIDNLVKTILLQWSEFEEFARSKEANVTYFQKVIDQRTGAEIVEVNFDGYYKGSTVDADLAAFNFKLS